MMPYCLKLQLPLPLLIAHALAGLTASTFATEPTEVVTPPAGVCVVTAGARTFNLSELGGGGHAGAAPPLRHVSQRPDSRGWAYTFSACSYVVSLLRPKIIRDLELTKHGLHIMPLETTFNPYLDGTYLLRGVDAASTRRMRGRGRTWRGS